MGIINYDVIPFIWEECDEIDINASSYYQVTFLEDFGKIKKGNYSDCNVFWDDGIIEVIDEDGTETRQKFIAKPVDDKETLNA